MPRICAITSALATVCGLISAQPITTRVSVSSQGGQANQTSLAPSISHDGLIVAFASHADNLVPNDTNGTSDVFVVNVLSSQTTRVSVTHQGQEGNGFSTSPALSACGRYVVFMSDASNLVPNDTNGVRDVFVYDRASGQIERVSVNSAGTQGNDYSGPHSISADGRLVAFYSLASNLVPGDTNGRADVFVHDRVTRLTTRASVDSTGQQANGESGNPYISADGRFIAFDSSASNLVPGDTNNDIDVFVRDLALGQTTRVSVSTGNSQAAGWSSAPSVSSNGRFVAFESTAPNLVSGDTNAASDVFVRDVLMGSTSRVSVGVAGSETNGWSGSVSISADGRFVAFSSNASNLVPNDTNGVVDAFVADRRSNEIARVSVSSFNSQGNGHTFTSVISGDGRYVALQSEASNLVPGDTNGARDVFLRGALYCPGDANGDRVINFMDLNILLGYFGQSGVNLPPDFNGDGVVDFIDLNICLSAFGASC